MSEAQRWDRPIIVLSQGRSGSTLLQRLLNVHPDLTVWGEHGAFLKGVASAHRLIVDHPSHSPNLRRGHEVRHNMIGPLSDVGAFEPWASPFLPEDVGDALRLMLTGLFTRGLQPSVRWGFKEVRYSARDIEPFLALFPEAHVVVLVREFFDWVPSRFFAFGRGFDLETEPGRAEARRHVEELGDAWLTTYEPLADLVDGRGELATAVDYSELTDVAAVTDLFVRLGEEPPERESLEPVMTARVGSTFDAARPAAARDALTELVATTSLDRARLRAVRERLVQP